MATYNFFRFDIEGQVKGTELHECKDDLDALDTAYANWSEYNVEIWCGALRIAFVTRELRQVRAVSQLAAEAQH